MKKLLTMITVLLITLTTSVQFEQDKVYVGGSLTGLNLSYDGLDKLNLSIQTQAGYLLEDNLIALGNLSYRHGGYESVPDYISMSVDGRYYIVQNGICLGASYKLTHTNHNYNDVMPGVKAGYAYFLSRMVIIEPVVHYDQSFEKCSDSSTIGFKMGIGMYL